ncbi:MAG: transcription elongation factor GreA [Elusimicrobiota bacterium]
MSDNHVTKQEYDKMIEQMEKMKKRRKELSAAIGEAREQGDLRENAEYDAAKDAQGLNEKRIFELQELIATSTIIDYSKIPTDSVLIGATVKLIDLKTKEEVEYTLVAPGNLDFSVGNISLSSPLAQGLLNHKEGDEVSVQVPAGKLNYKVLKIYRK